MAMDDVVSPSIVRFVGTEGGVVSGAFATVRTRVADPVPAELMALSVTSEVTADVGVPEITPVDPLSERPDGRPDAVYEVGLLDAEIW